MKKVLFVIDSLACGGAEKSLLSLLSLLSGKDKYDLNLWILHRGGILESFLPCNVKMVETPKYTILEKFLYGVSRKYYSFIWRLNDMLKVKKHKAEMLWQCCGYFYKVPEENYDVAIAYQQGFPTFLVAKKIKSIKKIAWINADIFSMGYNKKFNKKYYKLYDKIVLVSDLLKRIVLKDYPFFNRNCICIYDIINPILVRENSKGLIPKLKKGADEICILTVGRLIWEKGYDLLINAAEELKSRKEKFVWYIIGDGSERTHILNLISKRGLEGSVKLLGLKLNPYPYMKQCDIYVQTSRVEGFGLTIAEAKILHKPIVSTDFEVIYNQLENETNGIIVEMNGKSIANGILKLLKDKSLCAKIVSNLKHEENQTSFNEIHKIERLFDENKNHNLS